LPPWSPGRIEGPHFTYRFAAGRLIPRCHLEGVEAGRCVSVFKIDPGTGERIDLLATATVGKGDGVDLPELILVVAARGTLHKETSARLT
jgi:hypothetical protein